MGVKASNMKGLMRNTRSRIIIILTVIILLVMVAVGVVKMRGGLKGKVEGRANIKNVPMDIRSVPGSEHPSLESERAQQIQNKRMADRALKTGNSQLPTIIRTEKVNDENRLTEDDAGYSFTALANLQNADSLGVDFGRSLAEYYRDRGLYEDLLGNDGLGVNGFGFLVGDPTHRYGLYGLGGPGMNGVSGFAGNSHRGERDCSDGKNSSYGANGLPGLGYAEENKDDPNSYGYGNNHLVKGRSAEDTRVALGADGKPIGTVGADGLVRDASGKVIGTVGADGLIRDVNGKVIGSAPPVVAGVSAGSRIALGADGKPIGTVDAGGVVRDASGKIIGTMGADGVIHDVNGKVIGTVAGVSLAMGPDGEPIGTVGADGKVRDATGKVIGIMGADGIVRDTEGKVIGSEAGTRLVMGPDGKPIGTVGADGVVRDVNGKAIGIMGADGVARGPDGKPIGTLGGARVALGPDGKPIGTVGADGLVRDASGKVIGKLGADGIVRDLKGRKIGSLAGVDIDQTAKNASSASTTFDQSANAQNKTPTNDPNAVVDADGKLIGTVGPDGMVRDANGKVIGTMGADGIVRGLDGHPVGMLNAKVVRDASGKIIGVAGTDGIVRDASGKPIGTVGSDGRVRGPDGRVIGVVGGGQRVVVDKNGREIGTVGPDGIVRDRNGHPVGTLGADGIVRDSEGKTIGTVGGPSGADEAESAQAIGASELDRLKKIQLAQISPQEKKQKMQEVQGQMAGQASQYFSNWSIAPRQTYTVGDDPKKAAPGGNAGNGAGAPGGNAVANGTKNIVKAGTIIFAVLDTAINTDEPGPLMASLTSGPYKGGKLLGAVKKNGDGQKVLISFNLMTLPSKERSIPINAVAIDPDTSQAAFSSYTDNHLLLRYGTLFASAFFSGVGQSVANSGSQLAVAQGGGTLIGNTTKSSKQNAIIGLGSIGQKLGEQATPLFSTPPTVYVNAGIGMGVLILTDLDLTDEKG